MLGIADLHTPEALAAAESAIVSVQPFIPLPASSSEAESEDSINDEDNDDDSDNDSDEIGNDDDDDDDDKTSKFSNDGSTKVVGNNSSRKPPKIVEMS